MVVMSKEGAMMQSEGRRHYIAGEAPGLDALVSGRVEYQGKTYYLAGRYGRGWPHDDIVFPVETRDKSLLLALDDRPVPGGTQTSVRTLEPLPQTTP